MSAMRTLACVFAIEVGQLGLKCCVSEMSDRGDDYCWHVEEVDCSSPAGGPCRTTLRGPRWPPSLAVCSDSSSPPSHRSTYLRDGWNHVPRRRADRYRQNPRPLLSASCGCRWWMCSEARSPRSARPSPQRSGSDHHVEVEVGLLHHDTVGASSLPTRVDHTGGCSVRAEGERLGSRTETKLRRAKPR